ncbi:DUF6143 family protein [Romboutsia sp. Marseille-P6047]|uniref:DUF6143 family protein n=1 Tax=Romboutsia sp. Marseille-P6047 TaxID=2161817 RepID=UPI000F065A0A|nr:DUF6143 family protein [Romboutsia sp. Marseille-P6047]
MKNQYNECGIKKLSPYYVSDVCSGHIQNNENKYYRGKSEVVKLKRGVNSVVTLKNPKNSEVIVYVNNTTVANISDVVVTENIYYSASATGNLIKSNNIISSNAPYGKNTKAHSEIYYGEDIKISNGVSTRTSMILPYSNLLGDDSGSVILYPGMEVVIELYLSDSTKEGEGIVSFIWWEEPIKIVEGD